MQNTKNEYLRVSQIIKEYPISTATIWRYAKLGTLHSRKVSSGITVFFRSELETLFNGTSHKMGVAI